MTGTCKPLFPRYSDNFSIPQAGPAVDFRHLFDSMLVVQ
jgi:hypothetical protein